MARLFDTDQVADGLSDFETEAESKDSMYESESDNSNSSESDASLDDSDATASDSDSSSSLGGASGGDDGDSSRDDVSTNGRGRGRGRGRGGGRGRGRGRAGVRSGRVGRGATGRRRRQLQGPAAPICMCGQLLEKVRTTRRHQPSRIGELPSCTHTCTSKIGTTKDNFQNFTFTVYM